VQPEQGREKYMTIIRIRQDQREVQPDEEQNFSAKLSFDHGAEYHITVKMPFSEEEEKELEWYFEEYLNYPFMRQGCHE
jgi:hypothetical protein